MHTVAVSDPRGEYKLARLLPGPYKIQSALAGFSSAVVERLELLELHYVGVERGDAEHEEQACEHRE